MKNSNIEWTDHTFNPWIGCTKVSPGCTHCYAEARDIRYAKGAHWGKGAPRQRTSEANWKQPLRWNKQLVCDDCGELRMPWRDGPGRDNDGRPRERCTCACTGFLVSHWARRPRVFCASLADWLDDEVPIEWLADLLKLIHDTPNLDWLLLTKRPENWSTRIDDAFGHLFGEGGGNATDFQNWLYQWRYIGGFPTNVWLGTTVENQHYTDRIVHLFRIPARVRFLSVEPMLGPVDFMPWMYMRPKGQSAPQLHWIICGGESGHGKRPFNLQWARDLRDQCAAAGVPFFMKQIDKIQPIPADLMIRQFPMADTQVSSAPQR